MRLLVTSVKHCTRAIAILAMFCCVLGPLVPLGNAQAIAGDTSEQKSNYLTCPEIEGYPKSADHESAQTADLPHAGIGTNLSRSQTHGYRERQLSSPATHASAAMISITPLTQPPAVVERTERLSVSYAVTYPNGSAVRTSTGTRVSVQEGGQVVGEVPLLLNETSSLWTATWASPYSANLTEHSFKLNPTDFDDSYGNLGQGQPLVSSSFKLIPATVTLNIQALSTLSRRQLETVTIPTVYHDGSPLQNATFKASIAGTNGTVLPLNMTLNGVSATKDLDLPANADLGAWRIRANFTDGFGNHGEGNFAFQVVAARIKFSVTLPQPVERTTRMNVTSSVTYPDGQSLTAGVNGNVSIGNMTQSLNLQYIWNNQTWNGLYYLSQNATVGIYNVTIDAADSYGNVGRFTTPVTVVPASFRFAVPVQQAQVAPVELTDIVVSVTYPNGTALGNNVGVVTGIYNNSTGGTSTVLLQYNATDTKWHVIFLTPDQRFKLFAITIIFAFEAHDIFGNSGSASDAYEMTVTTPINLLIIAAVIGIIVPASLLAWAMLTVTKKRRKHKP